MFVNLILTFGKIYVYIKQKMCWSTAKYLIIEIFKFFQKYHKNNNTIKNYRKRASDWAYFKIESNTTVRFSENYSVLYIYSKK